jgi:hypothetical protein
MKSSRPKSLPFRAHEWFASWCYRLGLSSGGMYGQSAEGYETRIYWRGKRCYFLNWPRWKWRCVFKFHHWPTPYLVGLGFCGRCCPWPCCGAITREHAAGCVES